MDRIEIAGLSVAEPLARFLDAEVFPGAGVAARTSGPATPPSCGTSARA